MAASCAERRAGVLLAVALAAGLGAAPAAQAAPAKRVQQAIVLDADSFDGGLASNKITFHKVRINQGEMSISADLGQGVQKKSGIDFDNSVWNFRGNVKISMDHGQLNSDDAQITFVKQLLATAEANGKPATFEQKIEKTGKVAEGRADTIDYDAGKHLVRLTNDAWLSDGQTEIRGQALKYDMLAQSIIADPAEQNSQRVHIVITPPPAKP
jgi:lipopolysaccharide export system protein LptA